MTFAAETSSNGNSRCQSSGGKADHLQQAFVDDNVAISPNAPEEVPTLLKRIAMHGEAYLTESDENERTRILDAARSLVYALETPREAIIRHCWSQVSHTYYISKSGHMLRYMAEHALCSCGNRCRPGDFHCLISGRQTKDSRPPCRSDRRRPNSDW